VLPNSVGGSPRLVQGGREQIRSPSPFQLASERDAYAFGFTRCGNLRLQLVGPDSPLSERQDPVRLCLMTSARTLTSAQTTFSRMTPRLNMTTAAAAKLSNRRDSGTDRHIPALEADAKRGGANARSAGRQRRGKAPFCGANTRAASSNATDTSHKTSFAAIDAYLTANNTNPMPFTWTKTADQIIEKVQRGRLTLDAIVN